MPLAIGARLGPYEIVAPIGAGGMGEVYRARDSRLGREVALKVIVGGRELDPARRRRFADEARAASAISHPNVLTLFDTGLDADLPYVVFELLEGVTLRDRLRRQPLSPREATEIAAQVCDGLAAAHEKGIVHRDLKPENLFLARDGRVRILDFGLARLGDALAAEDAADARTPTATAPGALIGTVAYMSPEQVRGERADARSDIFAVGATLYEMVTGRAAFLRATPADTISAILTQSPPELPASPTDAGPAALGPILSRCMEKDPARRFQTARDLAFALRVLFRPGAGDGAPAPRGRAPRWRGLLPLLASSAIVAAAGFLLLRQASSPAPEPPRPVPFTAFRGREVAPAFSPDGSQIAFAWTGEGEGTDSGFDLYVKVIGGERPLRLTTRPAAWIAPAWSPDGRRIAFSRAGTDAPGIYLIPALGGQERKLLAVRSEAFAHSLSGVLTWSPDGRLLAFADWDAAHPNLPGISVIDVETLERRQLAAPAAECKRTWLPAFSPDGASLAVACMLSQGREQLYVMPSSGGTGRALKSAPLDLTGLAWTSDGTSVVFTADGDLWSAPRAGGAGARRVLVGRDAQLPAASRVGNRLAYTQETGNTNIWRLPLASPTRSAGSATRLVSSSRSQRHPAFSPEGSRIAFESTRSGALEIWTSAADGSHPVQLTSFSGPMTGSPEWSPNGEHIVFDSRATGESALYLVGPEGGSPRRLETGVGDSSTPAWAPDGQFVYFSGTVASTPPIFRIRLDGGPALQITTQGGFLPRVSPDGRRVYYVHGDLSSEIWSASAEGGDERPLAGVPARSAHWQADWLVSAPGIYLLDGDPPRPGIDFFDFATGRTTRVADVAGPLEPWGGGLALSPDGRSLLFSRIDEIASDIMLVEGFR